MRDTVSTAGQLAVLGSSVLQDVSECCFGLQRRLMDVIVKAIGPCCVRTLNLTV